ncbi:hypothetical protein [Streptomyces tropicalis]|uniref:PH domain-containing protein n=1 Tax=Streptomyces tropicalis TaxID=3034234 RepID=A0ABT6AEM1_9ACTN|nr:hypothetical protein [Streptomyces tropicalis]MDF3303103.1 hypothetical protein [Streptomyces tropicalis]
MKASYARRRTLRGAWAVSSLWAAIVCADAGLIRSHVLEGSWTGVSALAGALAGPALVAIRYGFAGRPSMVVQSGRYFVSARTMTGVRTLRLDGLVSVRRFTTIARSGGCIDELHLRDEQQVRLTVGNEHPVSTQVRQAVRRAESRPGRTIAVTRHARTGLGLEPGSRLPEGVHRLWAFWITMAALGTPALVGYVTACVLAGTSIVGTPGR